MVTITRIRPLGTNFTVFHFLSSVAACSVDTNLEILQAAVDTCEEREDYHMEGKFSLLVFKLHTQDTINVILLFYSLSNRNN